MATGLAVPVRVGSNGGSVTVSGDEYARQTLYVGLSDHDNTNAFQQGTGLGEGMIFGLDNDSTKASVLRKLYAMFDIWETERLFRLMRETIKWSSVDGELILEFKYVNLETDKIEDFHKRFLTGA